MYSFDKSNLLSIKTKLLLFRHSKLFSRLTTFIIIFYSLLIGYETHYKGSTLIHLFNILDVLISIYFVFEIGIKIFTEKNKMDFFKSKWNTFDFIVVFLSIIPLNLFDSVVILRLLRIFRILRLVTANDEIKKILMALQEAIPAIMNIVILMFIIFYIYAILGNQFFSGLQSGLWENFSVSMLTLFRILTFEDWTDVMYEAMEVYPYSWIYFISFIIINAFVVFNLFVAVIIDEISKIKDRKIQDTLLETDHNTILILREIKELKNEIENMKKERM